MRYGIHRTPPVIRLHDISFQTRASSHQQNDRNFCSLEHPALGDREYGWGFDENDSVHLLGKQKFQIDGLFVLLVVTVAEQDAVARLLGRVLGATHDGWKE